MTGPQALPPSAHNRRDARSRIVWLDVFRLVTIFEIVGFHWLRTCQENPAYGLTSTLGYKDTGNGFDQLWLLLLTDRHDWSPGMLVNNAISTLFGIGWEAVNVFVLLSGLTLALNYHPHRPGFSLLAWCGHRLRRILVPYYAIGFSLILLAAGFVWIAGQSGGALGQMAAKLAGKNLADPLWIVLLKHLLLVDPRQPLWLATPFSPAWWFIAPILVGYLAFPLFYRAVERLGQGPALLGALGVSACFYWLADVRVLPIENGWYFVVLHECFDFMLGIVIGRLLTEPSARDRIEAFVASPRGLGVGVLLFAAGNVANWYSPFYPIASALFTPGLSLLLAAAAVALSRFGSVLGAVRRWDSYRVYLLHQFMAFPLVVLTAALFGRWTGTAGMGAGLVFYIAMVLVVVAAVDGFVRAVAAMRDRARSKVAEVL